MGPCAWREREMGKGEEGEGFSRTESELVFPPLTHTHTYTDMHTCFDLIGPSAAHLGNS